MKTASVLVIGAGIGGMATATHLAQRGLHVTVLEKNRRPGGRCDRLCQDGHRFDTGPTLLVMPLVYEREFAALGSSLRGCLHLRRVDPTYHLVFDDASQLALTSDLADMRDQLERIEAGSFDGFLRYMEEGRDHYELAMERLVDHDFRHAADFFHPRNLPLLFQLKPLLPHYQHMEDFFQSPRLKAAFTFQDIYMGLSPFSAPATFSMMPYSELAHGVWYPTGGMYQVAQVLYEAALAAGVEFMFDAPVQRIDVRDHHASCVVLEDGRRLQADIIVANADLPYVYERLLPYDLNADMNDKQYSCSVISFFWGVDKAYPQIAPHMLFLTDSFEDNFRRIEQRLDLPDHPSLYMHAPARIDADAAPPKEDTLIAVVPVGHMDEARQQDWAGVRERARGAVFERLGLLGIHDLEQHIKFEVNFTPPSWQQRYNLQKGATHGLAHTLLQLGYLRPHNRHARYQNLYFVGASTHPGTGIPTALISGRLTAQRVIDESVM
jgi:phytoene desaturase